MRRTIRRTLIFIGLVLIGAIAFFPYNQYAGDLKGLLEKEARQRGIVLEIESLNFGFPNRIGATGIAAILPQGKINIPLWINNVEVIPEFWPLMSRKVVASLSGKAYAGDLSGALDWQSKTGNGTVNLKGTNLDLELHPLFQAISATGKGTFTFESGLNLISGGPGRSVLLQPVGAKFDLTVEKGSIPENRGFGPLFVVPQISEFNLQTKVEQNDQTINIKTFKIDSSLGKLDATGTVHLTGVGRFDNTRATGSLELTEDGWRAFGPQLLLLARIQKPDPIYSWNMSVDYSAGGFPNVRFLPQ